MKILSSRFASVAALVGIAVAAPPTLAISPAAKNTPAYHPAQLRPVSAPIPYRQPRLRAPLPFGTRAQLPRDPRWAMLGRQAGYPSMNTRRPAMPTYQLPRLQRPAARLAPPRAPMIAQRPPMPRFATPQAPRMARMAPPRAPMTAQRPPMPRFGAPRGPRATQGWPMAYAPKGLWRPMPWSSRFVAGLQQRPPLVATPAPAFRGWQQARPQISPRAQASRSTSLYRPKLAAQTDNPWRGLNDG
jgi:hypothetical protein